MSRSISGGLYYACAIDILDGTLIITPGTVTITSDLANNQPKSVASTGGAVSFTLKSTFQASAGDISIALPVSYTLTPIGPRNTFTCTDSSGNGMTDGVPQSQCTFTGVVPNGYTLTISSGGNYTGTTTDTVTGVDQRLAFVAGNGTLSHGGQTGKFQLSAEYQRGGLAGRSSTSRGPGARTVV